MELVNWDSSMSVGVEVFDTQHRTIFKMINALAESMEHGKGADLLGKTLEELKEYCLVHFNGEEIYFERFLYADTKDHIKQHKFFIQKVTTYKNNFDNGVPVFSGNLILFLQDWWIHHIQETDKMYGEYFNERGLF